MICLLYNRFIPLYLMVELLIVGLPSVIIQQSCDNALPLAGEELAHMKYNFWKAS